MKKLLLILFLLPLGLVAQEKSEAAVPVLNFEELQPLLQQNNDTTYVINFWATWCIPCIKEIPAFEELTKKYKGQAVKVILVSLDFKKNLNDLVIPYIQKNHIQSKVVLLSDPNANEWINKVSKDWTGAIPATVIYHKQDRKFYERSFSFPELEAELKTFHQQ